jgi:putative PIN family toxin of toxin-antitoxin system
MPERVAKAPVQLTVHSIAGLAFLNFGIPYNTKMKPDIVLDTNVLLTALRSSKGTSYRLLSMLTEDRFQLHISATLVAEYEAVLKRGLLALTADQIDDVVDFICATATHHKIYYLWRPVLKDPGNDFVLELAVKANARIVTWNVADFKRARPLGVVVQTPREFLNLLEDQPT